MKLTCVCVSIASSSKKLSPHGIGDPSRDTGSDTREHTLFCAVLVIGKFWPWTERGKDVVLGVYWPWTVDLERFVDWPWLFC